MKRWMALCPFHSCTAPQCLALNIVSTPSGRSKNDPNSALQLQPHTQSKPTSQYYITHSSTFPPLNQFPASHPLQPLQPPPPPRQSSTHPPSQPPPSYGPLRNNLIKQHPLKPPMLPPHHKHRQRNRHGLPGLVGVARRAVGGQWREEEDLPLLRLVEGGVGVG